MLYGAGSSDFIGRILAPWLLEATGLDVGAGPTTDIVLSTLQCLHPSRPTLLVSYGRLRQLPKESGRTNAGRPRAVRLSSSRYYL